jgi:hypothetical protein
MKRHDRALESGPLACANEGEQACWPLGSHPLGNIEEGRGGTNMSRGPDFTQRTKNTLAKRAGQTCSNPDCRRLTSGPHSQNDKAMNLGEAAHIRAAREGQARYDPSMTNEERADISNGIWLCRECAKKIDADEATYTVERLNAWKRQHEDYIATGKPEAPGAREVRVSEGGVGSFVENVGGGIGLDITHSGEGPAERITVEGSGIGEIITNTGDGVGKRVTKTGGGSASKTTLIVNEPVHRAVALSSKIVWTTCSRCGSHFSASVVVQGFAGDREPQAEVTCPRCHLSVWV